MTYSIPLQIINGSIATLAFCLIIVFVNYIYVYRNEGYVFLRPAIAFLTLWTGVFTLRFPIFIARTRFNAGDPLQEVPWNSITVGSFITIIAFFCTIRVFSPREWRHWSWLGSLLLMIAVTGLSLLYVFN